MASSRARIFSLRAFSYAVTVSLALACAASAAPLSQTGMPSGRHAGRKPIGWVIVIHGGAWKNTGAGAMATVAPDAAWLNAAGWATLNVDYRPGAIAEADMRNFYARVRRQAGPRTPICAFGQSAGAQLALILAAQRPKVACVIAEGAPVDLLALSGEKAYDAVTGLLQGQGPLKALTLAIDAFGQAALGRQSPVNVAGRIKARVLAATSTFDPLVPLDQLDLLEKALPSATTMRLEGGDQPFIHAGISAQARKDYNHAKRVLLRATAAAAARR